MTVIQIVNIKIKSANPPDDVLGIEITEQHGNRCFSRWVQSVLFNY
jgi:hypothetical protein